MTKHVEAANWWRVPAPKLEQGKYHSVIIDHGEMVKAVPDSKNRYLFSESGTGVKPLAIVGTALQIVELLERSAKHSIGSDIKELPKLYMGVSLFEPKKRFDGVFPLNQVAMDIFTFGMKVWGNYKGSKAEKIAHFIADLLKANTASKQKGNLLFVKFSYLQENGMREIGKLQVSCKDLQQLILEQLPVEK